jgi:hypothetical protein
MKKQVKSTGIDIDLMDLVLLGVAIIFLALVLGAVFGFAFIVFIVVISDPLLFLTLFLVFVIAVILIKILMSGGDWTW